MSFFSKLLSGIEDLFKSITDAFADLINGAIDLIGDVLGSIGSTLAEMGGWIVIIIIVIIVLIYAPVIGPWLVNAINAAMGFTTAAFTVGQIAAALAVLAIATAFVAYQLDPEAFRKGLNDAFEAIAEPIFELVGEVIVLVTDAVVDVADNVLDALGIKNLLIYGVLAFVGYKVITKESPSKVVTYSPDNKESSNGY